MNATDMNEKLEQALNGVFRYPRHLPKDSDYVYDYICIANMNRFKSVVGFCHNPVFYHDNVVRTCVTRGFSSIDELHQLLDSRPDNSLILYSLTLYDTIDSSVSYKLRLCILDS